MQLTPGPDGFYTYPTVPGAPVVYCSPDGADSNAGADAAAPLKTLTAARKKLKPGKPGTMLLLGGAVFKDQQLWIDGGTNDGPHVIGTYGRPGRAVIDVSAPAPTETACQVRGTSFVSDIEFVCEAGKPGVRPQGKFDFVAQNVKVSGANLGWDMADVTAWLHRCLTLDIYSPTGDKSQGAYISRGLLRIMESVFHRCGWKPTVPLTLYATDKNHTLYVDEDCQGATTIDGSFFGEPCSHGTQLRTGGAVKRSVYYRCPIGGFHQGPTGVIEDTFFEQQNSYVLGHGTAPATFTEPRRGWGWSLESTTAEMSRCGFYRGGGDSPNARAIDLAKVNPGRTPPRPAGEGIAVAATRIAGWTGGVTVTAPVQEVLAVDVEVDKPEPRWAPFTVAPLVEQFRRLDRGSDWTVMARAAADGYAALEQVILAGPARTAIAAGSRLVAGTMDALGKI
jgi:hypothetical protein